MDQIDTELIWEDEKKDRLNFRYSLDQFLQDHICDILELSRKYRKADSEGAFCHPEDIEMGGIIKFLDVGFLEVVERFHWEEGEQKDHQNILSIKIVETASFDKRREINNWCRCLFMCYLVEWLNREVQ